MTEKIDELVAAATAIKSDVSHVLSSLQAVNIKVDKLNDQSIRNESSIVQAHSRIDTMGMLVAAHDKTLTEAVGARRVISWGWTTAMALAGFVISAIIAHFAS